MGKRSGSKPTGRVSAVVAARRGAQVLRLASYGVAPTEIAREANLSRRHVHRILAAKERAYRERQLVGRLRGDVA
jgi:DNA invertase Pin-like site-specific DNA recombinase